MQGASVGKASEGCATADSATELEMAVIVPPTVDAMVLPDTGLRDRLDVVEQIFPFSDAARRCDGAIRARLTATQRPQRTPHLEPWNPTTHRQHRSPVMRDQRKTQSRRAQAGTSARRRSRLKEVDSLRSVRGAQLRRHLSSEVRVNTDSGNHVISDSVHVQRSVVGNWLPRPLEIDSR